MAKTERVDWLLVGTGDIAEKRVAPALNGTEKSRIIAVCDVFDAITSDRPYRRKMDTKEAIAELKAGLGTQFDPVIVGAFLLAYEKGKIMSVDM